MSQTSELLRQVHGIADPSEAIIQEAERIASDPETAPEIAQACADLAATVRQVFGIAGYIMREGGK